MLKTPGFSSRLVRWGLFGALLISLFGLTGPTLPTARANTVFDIPNGDITALKAALATPGTNIINLAPGGTYTLTATDNTTNGANGLPAISNTVTINGNGATLARATNAPTFRFFFVGPIGSLSVNNLTFYDGNLNDFYSGGAILNYGNLSLNTTTFYSNTNSVFGGAIGNVGQGTNATTNPGTSYTATLIITNSTFISNSAYAEAGAIFNASQGGNASNNIAGGNGTALAFVSGSTFVSSTTNSGGGAIYNAASDGNAATGGIGRADFNLTNSTLANNQAASGGAIINIELNSGTNNPGLASATLTVTNTTIAGNSTSTNGSAAILTGKQLGGNGSANATLYNTIVASNAGGNCAASGASFGTGQNNLEYTGAAGSTTCGTGSTLVTTNPVAASTTTDNGGPTYTILPTGPAIDGGSNAICAAAPVNNLDQRGASRPVGAACDVGAVESGGGLVVRYNADSGDTLTAGTLSYAFKYATGGLTISFALIGGSTITVSKPLSALPLNARLGTGCDGIVIVGTGVASDGLILSGNNIVKGVSIRGFGKRQIVTAGPGNQLVCTRASKN